DILIPVAPALFVVAVGVWRNVCPLATTNLLPRHLSLSKRKKLSTTQLGKLNLIAVIALYIIVPLRHALFNHNGLATGIIIISMAVIGVTLGFFYEWKSAWCSGLCPVHPVEKLYGGNVFMSMPNANCNQCANCVIPCPDSTPNMNPKISAKTIYHKISGILVVGGLPGFIWGWFHVPDENKITTLTTFFSVYQIPLIGLAVTLTAYIIISNIIAAKYERRLISIFAASGVSCYYWYRIPELFGFGKFADDGLLISLKNILPAWSIFAMIICTTAFFFYWLVIRERNNRSWVVRPQFVSKEEKLKANLPA
ncbi:MAG: hypothetical protein KGL19_09380, partial [Bacteroidota bacterium]|nr:hypothetical protein [Bacteroidota bacterium]